MYTNMCFYVWQVRVKNQSRNIKKSEEQELFTRFRLLAREKIFDNVLVEHIPRPPPKPVSKKRTKIGELTPLLTSDSNFKAFGLPPAVTFVATQLAGNFNHVQSPQLSQGDQDALRPQSPQIHSGQHVHDQQSRMGQQAGAICSYEGSYDDEHSQHSTGTIQVPATQYPQSQRLTRIRLQTRIWVNVLHSRTVLFIPL